MTDKKRESPRRQIDERVDEPERKSRAPRADTDAVGKPGEAPLASASHPPRADGGDRVPRAEQPARRPEEPLTEQVQLARGPTDPRREED